MLGGHGIVWTKIEADKIYGTVIYDLTTQRKYKTFVGIVQKKKCHQTKLEID